MNKIFTIILSIVLSLPIQTWAVDAVDLTEPTENQTTVINTLDEDIVPADNSQTFKQPISKRKIAKKFLLAMGSVAISSLFLYIILTVYNRIRETNLKKIKTSQGEVSLETPDDLKSAVKTFLDKTKW